MSANMTQPLRAVSYIRVNRAAESDELQAARRIYQQRRDCAAIAAELGAEIVREHIDEGGVSTLHRRPVLQQVLDELATSPAAYLITSDLDRLSRNLQEMQALRARLQALGVKLATWQTLHYNELVEAIYFAVADFTARDRAQRQVATGRRQTTDNKGADE